LDDADCVSAFFAQNIVHSVGHPRLHAIPIGLEDRRKKNGRERGAFASLNPLRGILTHVAQLEKLCLDLGVLISDEPNAVHGLSLTRNDARMHISSLAYSAFTIETNPTVRCDLLAVAEALGGVISIEVRGNVEGLCPEHAFARAEEGAFSLGWNNRNGCFRSDTSLGSYAG